MTEKKPLNRRSFLTRIAGGAIVGGGAINMIVGGEALAIPGVTDHDANDPSGNGRGVTDSDSNDRAGFGRGSRAADAGRPGLPTTTPTTRPVAAVATRASPTATPTTPRAAGAGRPASPTVTPTTLRVAAGVRPGSRIATRTIRPAVAAAIPA